MRQSSHLNTVTLANMYFSTSRGAIVVDKSQNEAEPRRTWGDSPITITNTPFNHEAFYESHRNQLAIMAGKAYKSETKSKLMDISHGMRSCYSQYSLGKVSEETFKQYAESALNLAKVMLEDDRNAD